MNLAHETAVKIVGHYDPESCEPRSKHTAKLKDVERILTAAFEQQSIFEAGDDAQHVSNLAMLVGRLVQQLRSHDNENSVAEQAMDYLRRSDLIPSMLRGTTANARQPKKVQ